MPLYLLQQKAENQIYESVDCMVVRAQDEASARAMAQRNSDYQRDGAERWDDAHATAEPIEVDGGTEIILASWQNGS